MAPTKSTKKGGSGGRGICLVRLYPVIECLYGGSAATIEALYPVRTCSAIPREEEETKIYSCKMVKPNKKKPDGKCAMYLNITLGSTEKE